MHEHEYHMKLAIDLAKDAEKEGDVPVGAVIVDANGHVIGRGKNRRWLLSSATSHAEIEAIEDACKKLGDWRLDGCSLYVTLEPCPMCAGAVIMSRISRLYYGARDDVTGSCGSVINLFMEKFGQSTQVTGGILADECGDLLTGFFKERRG